MRARLETTLDGTKFSDFDDDFLINVCKLTSDEVARLRKLPEIQLSSLIPVIVAIGNKEAAKKRIKQMPLPLQRAEINCEGRRRCVYVQPNGERCVGYGDKDVPLCKKHGKKATMLGNHFRSPALRDTYKQFFLNPQKMNCDSELALMRTMLATLLQRLDGENLNVEIIAGVTTMCEKITATVERISKLEKVTPEHLTLLMKQMTEIAAKYIPADKLEAFAADVESVSIEPNRVTQSLPYLPGVEVEVNGEKTKVDVQKRALIEVAEQMGVVTDAK